MDGIFLINKLVGSSSYDVIRHIKRGLDRKVKIGHAGTLDPFASGLLIIMMGKATKLFDGFQDLRKTYLVTSEFGYLTDTYDVEGERVFEDEKYFEKISKEKIASVLKEFSGDILQKPPRFSAKKIGGKRAYELARKKIDFDIEPKKVTVYNLELVEYSQPFLKLRVECSKGTYIRSLVVDIAESLGSVASAVELVRESIGHFNLSDAVDVNDLDITKDLINLEDIKL